MASMVLAIVAVVASAAPWTGAPSVEAAVPGRTIGPEYDGNGDVLQLKVTERGGIPANAAAVAITITVTSPEAPGYITAWPCLSPFPAASVVNYAAGQTVANLVVVKPGVRGKVCIRSSQQANVLADVSGYFPAGTAFRPSAVPVRRLDTRTGAKLVPGVVQRVRVSNVAGVPTGAPAVAVNLTATSPNAAGYLKVFPCGQATPSASAINFSAGQTIANLSMLAPGSNGDICILSSQPTHLLVDLFGHYAQFAGFTPVAPNRIVDTRVGQGGTRLAAGATLPITVSPANAAAVALNLTAVNPSGNGYLTVFPCGTTRPNASSVNFQTARTISNFVLAKPGAGGQVCVWTSTQTDLLADRFGYTPAIASFTAPTPSRLLDTRSGFGMPQYDFLYESTTNVYARWNKCSGTVLKWGIINHLGNTQTELNVIINAFNDLEQGTGFDFQYQGVRSTSDEGNEPLASDFGVDILAGYDDDQFPGNVIGIGGFYSSGYEIVEGFLYLRDGVLSPAEARDVALHELGHMAGLGHVDDDTQLMFPTLFEPHQAFETGDWEGLKMVGTQMPCFPATLRSGPYDRDDLVRVTAVD